MVGSNEVELYGIKSDVERYAWIAYLSVVVVSALCGDVFILLAARRDKVFKLHVWIVALIQQIAVCDLVMAVGYITPIIISLIYQRWVLWDAFAYLQEFLAFTAFPISNILVCALTTSKYMLLRYRLETRSWTARRAHCASAVLWLVCSLFSCSLFLLNGQLQFSYVSYEVDFKKGGSAFWKYTELCVGLLYCVPICVVILTSMLTAKFLVHARRVARRSGGSFRWQGILAILLTGVIYCISSLPYTVYKMRSPFVNSSGYSYFHVEFKRHSEYINLLNVMANFYIYSLTVRSFRRYLHGRIENMATGTLRRLSSLRPVSLSGANSRELHAIREESERLGIPVL